MAQPTVYLVRHAEKVEGWPGGPLSAFQPLSTAGEKTAFRLAEYFTKIRLRGIFSSATTRTLQTVFPTSERQDIDIQIAQACSDTAQIDSFLMELSRKYTASDSVLIVSHSNIIPYYLIKTGLSKARYDEMGFTKSRGWLLTDYYGALFVLNTEPGSENKDGKLKRIRF